MDDGCGHPRGREGRKETRVTALAS